MIQQFRYWLPIGTTAPAALERKIAALVDDWSRSWIAEHRLRSFGVQRTTLRIGARATGRAENRCAADLAVLKISLDGKHRLALAALGLDGGSDLNAADLDLIGQLAGDILSDFERRFGVFAKLPATAWERAEGPVFQAQESFMIEIGESSEAPLFRVELSSSLFAQLACDSLAPVSKPGLGQGAKALERTPVSIGAMLGRSTLSVAELENLAAGDVIVLDRLAGAPLPLAIDGTETSTGRCRVTEAAAAVALEVTHPVAGAIA